MPGIPMKVLLVFGTRPEAIKLAPVIRELKIARAQQEGSAAVPGAPGGVPTVRVCVTAQHREMRDQVLRLFDITPDHDLRVMESNQTPTQVAAAVLARLEPILATERADWVVVQGDTTTVATAVNPYGDGKASGRIVRALLEHGPSTRTT